MEKEISQQQITDYIKLLVEYGGLFTVQPDYSIHNPDGEVEQMVVKGKAIPMKIFNSEMTTGSNVIYLNPFKESLTASGERTWFWSLRSVILGCIIKRTLDGMISKILRNDESLQMEELDLVKAIMDQVDDKTEAALGLLKGLDFAEIVYHKKSKVAQLQCRVLDPEFQAEFKSKIRKKDWTVVTTFMSILLQTDQPEKLYTHSGTIIGMMEAEAILTVLTKITEAIAPYVKLIIGIELPVAEMIRHLALLEKYHKLVMWYQPPSRPDAVPMATKLPWELDKNIRPPGSIGSSHAVVPASEGAGASGIRPSNAIATRDQTIPGRIVPAINIPTVHDFVGKAAQIASSTIVPTTGFGLLPGPSVFPQPQLGGNMFSNLIPTSAMPVGFRSNVQTNPSPPPPHINFKL